MRRGSLALFAAVGMVLLIAIPIGLISNQAKIQLLPSNGAQVGSAGYKIYRVEFTINTTATSATFDFSGIFLYNLSQSSSVSISWTSTNFLFSRTGSSRIDLQLQSFVYIPAGQQGANLTIIENSGWTNFTIYNYNGATPLSVYSVLDQKTGGGLETAIPNLSSLTSLGPVFTVHDTLRNHVSREVYAYYYPWYSPSDWVGSGRNCTGCSSVSGVPEFGFYNSQNTTVIDQQISLARNAGIDGFLVAWGSNDSFSSQATTIVFQEAQKLLFPVTIYYQSKSLLSLSTSAAQAKFVSDIESILSTYGSSPEMLKIKSVPALFIFNVDEYPVSFWSSAISQIRSEYLSPFYIIGDSFNASYFSAFDGLSVYNVNFNNILVNVNSGHTNGTLTSYYNLEIAADLQDKLWFGPVMTGFDNVNDALESLSYWPRQNGSTYELTWTLALNSVPDGITITSWNEWHEGTNIEPLNTNAPSPEYWAYSNQYLDLTAQEIQAFEGTQSSTTSSSTSSVDSTTSQTSSSTSSTSTSSLTSSSSSASTSSLTSSTSVSSTSTSSGSVTNYTSSSTSASVNSSSHSSSTTTSTTSVDSQSAQTSFTSPPNSQVSSSSSNSSKNSPNYNGTSQDNTFLSGMIRVFGLQGDSGVYIASTFAGLTSLLIVGIGAVPLIIYSRKGALRNT